VDAAHDRIVRLGMDGSTAGFPLPRAGVQAAGIVAGPDGALWFIRGSDAIVGRVDIGFEPPIVASGTTFYDVMVKIAGDAKVTSKAIVTR
jgi:streptogramin lyase